MLVSTKLTVILHVAVSLALTTKFEAIGPSVNGAVISDLLTGVDLGGARHIEKKNGGRIVASYEAETLIIEIEL